MSALASLEDPNRVAVIAHRGASRAARENTVEAFTKAAALRADAVELDVRRCADGRLAVHHDPEVEGVGLIAGLDLDALRRRAPWVPTLAEALDACAGMWVNVEVKNLPGDPDYDAAEQAAEVAAAEIAAAGAAERVVVSSFNPASTAAVRRVAPGLWTALLTVGWVDPVQALEAAAEAGHRAFHPIFSSLEGAMAAAVVERGRSLGVAVVPWTVDDPAEMERLADAGVSGIITNVPDVARSVLG